MNRVIYISLIFFITVPILSQDSLIIRKNTIAIAPTSMLNRSIALAYYRQLNPRVDLTLKSRYRFDKKYKAYEEHNDVFSTGLLIQDPFWYYNKLTAQLGASFSSNQIVFVEPTLLYEYGYFNNKTLFVDDKDGSGYDEHMSVDRKYHAVGAMLYLGIHKKYRRIRLKYIIGFGYNYRFYQEKVLEEWNDLYYGVYPQNNSVNEYTKHRPAIKLGVELGIQL